MKYRRLGNTGLNVSIIGFGGIAAMNMLQEDADRVVANAVEHGVNYFDVAPTYGDAEDRLGPALRPFRKDVFLACKTHARTKEDAAASLQKSLDKLQTDYLDIYQFHGVPDMTALDEILSKGGAIETFVEAKEKGIIKFIGITTHTEDIAIEAFSRFNFDTILFPVNFICWYNQNNGPGMIKAAEEKRVGRIAMKGMARSTWPDDIERLWSKCWYQPIDDPELAELAMRFTLSQDVSVAIPPGHKELFEMALSFGERFTPITKDEENKLKEIAEEINPLFNATCSA